MKNWVPQYFNKRRRKVEGDETLITIFTFCLRSARLGCDAYIGLDCHRYGMVCLDGFFHDDARHGIETFSSDFQQFLVLGSKSVSTLDVQP